MRVCAEVSLHTALLCLGPGSQRQSDIRCRRHAAFVRGRQRCDALRPLLWRLARPAGWRALSMRRAGHARHAAAAGGGDSATCERLQTTRISSKALAACFRALTRPTSEVVTRYNVGEVVILGVLGRPKSTGRSLYDELGVSLRRGNGRSSPAFLLLSATPRYGRESVLHRGT